MATSAVTAHVYESVRRRSRRPTRQRRHALALLSIWLILVLKVVVVGSLAFGSGFVGVVALRALGWAPAGSADAVLATPCC